MVLFASEENIFTLINQKYLLSEPKNQNPRPFRFEKNLLRIKKRKPVVTAAFFSVRKNSKRPPTHPHTQLLHRHYYRTPRTECSRCERRERRTVVKQQQLLPLLLPSSRAVSRRRRRQRQRQRGVFSFSYFWPDRGRRGASERSA